MFTGKARSTQSEAPERCSRGSLLVNFRLGWKGLPGTNTLAYLYCAKITVVESFVTHQGAYA